jgi:hypothetical protein
VPAPPCTPAGPDDEPAPVPGRAPMSGMQRSTPACSIATSARVRMVAQHGAGRRPVVILWPPRASSHPSSRPSTPGQLAPYIGQRRCRAGRRLPEGLATISASARYRQQWAIWAFGIPIRRLTVYSNVGIPDSSDPEGQLSTKPGQLHIARIHDITKAMKYQQMHFLNTRGGFCRHTNLNIHAAETLGCASPISAA